MSACSIDWAIVGASASRPGGHSLGSAANVLNGKADNPSMIGMLRAERFIFKFSSDQ